MGVPARSFAGRWDWGWTPPSRVVDKGPFPNGSLCPLCVIFFSRTATIDMTLRLLSSPQPSYPSKAPDLGGWLNGLCRQALAYAPLTVRRSQGDIFQREQQREQRYEHYFASPFPWIPIPDNVVPQTVYLWCGDDQSESIW